MHRFHRLLKHNYWISRTLSCPKFLLSGYSTQEGEKDLYEVEVKFVFHPDRFAAWKDHFGSRLRYVGEKRISDVYYDDMRQDKYPLTTNDVWLRRRNERWECKVPCLSSVEDQEGSRTDLYREIVDEEKIQSYLVHEMGVNVQQQQCHQPLDVEMETLVTKHANLQVFAQFVTTRTTYCIDNEFMVDLDEADFGFHVGEVELVVHDEKQMWMASRRIHALLDECPQFFDKRQGRAMGKLLTYIKTKNPRHFDALERCGLIARKIGGSGV